MKKYFFIKLLCIAALFPANAINIEDLTSRIDGAYTSFAKAITHNMLLSSTWTTAFIGNFPHFGVSASAAVSTSNIGRQIAGLTSISQSITDLGKFTQANNNISGLGLNVLLGARAGLPYVPMDVGIHIFYSPAIQLGTLPFSLDTIYFIGLDTRWDFLGSDDNMALTVGGSYSYQHFGLNFNLQDTEVTFPNSTEANASATVKNFNANYSFDSHVIGIRGQYSIKVLGFLEFTAGFEPYLGISNTALLTRGLISISAGDKNYNFSTTQDLATFIRNTTGSTIDFSKMKVNSDMRVFGGMAIWIAFFQLDMLVSYGAISDTAGGSVAMRFIF